MEIVIDIEKKLGDFNLGIHYEGDVGTLGILGASGCGKSMTLQMIAGIKKPDRGYIRVGTRVMYDSGKGISVKPRDRRTGYLFQNYALFPKMTVRENIALALRGDRAHRQRLTEEMIERYRLGGLEERLPCQLSGGQQQRCALARMMATQPEIILLDEPFSALDVFLKDQLIQEMQEQLEAYEGLAVLVSHSRDEIYRLCPHIAVMDEGRLIRSGSREAVFASPGYVKAASLTGCKNIVEARRIDEHHLFLPLWNAYITVGAEIPGDVKAIGIRAHDMEPVWEMPEEEEGVVRVKAASVARLQFERQYYLEPEGGCSSPDERLRWFVQRDRWEHLDRRGMPPALRIPESSIMLLR